MNISFALNGAPHTVLDSESETTLLDYLHEEAKLTGCKYACGIGSCGACKVAVRERTATGPGAWMPVLACYARLGTLRGMEVLTVEGLAGTNGLHPLQEAFLRHFSFQCGYSTPGFLLAGFVLLDQLERDPVPRAELDSVLTRALAGHVCRCTGYERYARAIREVIDGTPGLVRDEVRPRPLPPVSFCVRKQSANDLEPKPLVGWFEDVAATASFTGGRYLDTWRATVDLHPAHLRTGEPIRDLNLLRFLFDRVGLRFVLDGAEGLQDRFPSTLLELDVPTPVLVRGRLHVGGTVVDVQADLRVTAGPDRVRIETRDAIDLPLHDIGLPVRRFATTFGLEFSENLQVTLALDVPYTLT